ncbi:hypothetical protein ACFOLA_05960 [Salinicoccus hispanicus]|uniref:Uncharacterized protein n=1 Tax=Salinicoccus hispanicus TaxID=157225 RepID=A0A6N8U1U8_9STAP|nr:hypothetical protein [Salinicoccus hispanicus]MXQ51307.1 hypothetical protein [Salinicoccus hispanicus]
MQSITLADAYAIESLRSNDYTNSDIMEKVKEGKTDDFKSFNKNTDYSVLDALNASGDLEAVLNDGYQVKFVTENGLKNLIKMKYGKEDGLDYLYDNNQVTGLQLAEDEQQDLKNMLSQNWVFKAEENGISITPAK